MATTLKRQTPAPDTWGKVASGLAEKLQALGQPSTSVLLEFALRELLDGQDENAKALREALLIHLTNVANGSAATESATKIKPEEMLSTEQAAQLMLCSRSYVAMLIDAEKLAGGVTSKDGHRKIPKSSVLRWIAATRGATNTVPETSDYRLAAVDAGMYSIPDAEYVKPIRGTRKGAE